MRFRFTVLLPALALIALIGGIAPSSSASAVNVGDTEGCTPGYWKQSQHFDSWEEYSPNQLVSTVFSNASPYSSRTLLQALNLRGGPGVDGAKQILLRAAVAAVLNAAHDSLEYPYRRHDPGFNGEPAIVPTVNSLLASGNRQAMLAFASDLDKANNLGCPLN